MRFFLMTIRCKEGFTQEDLAKKLATSKEHIDFLELKKNSELTFEDIVWYVSGLELECGLALRDKESGFMYMVKFFSLNIAAFHRYVKSRVEDIVGGREEDSRPPTGSLPGRLTG